MTPSITLGSGRAKAENRGIVSSPVIEIYGQLMANANRVELGIMLGSAQQTDYAIGSRF